MQKLSPANWVFHHGQTSTQRTANGLLSVGWKASHLLGRTVPPGLYWMFSKEKPRHSMLIGPPLAGGRLPAGGMAAAPPAAPCAGGGVVIGFPVGGVPMPMLAGGVTDVGGVPVDPIVGVDGLPVAGVEGWVTGGITAAPPAAPPVAGRVGITPVAFGLPELQPKPARIATQSSAPELVLGIVSISN